MNPVFLNLLSVESLNHYPTSPLCKGKPLLFLSVEEEYLHQGSEFAAMLFTFLGLDELLQHRGFKEGQEVHKANLRRVNFKELCRK